MSFEQKDSKTKRIFKELMMENIKCKEDAEEIVERFLKILIHDTPDHPNLHGTINQLNEIKNEISDLYK